MYSSMTGQDNNPGGYLGSLMPRPSRCEGSWHETSPVIVSIQGKHYLMNIGRVAHEYSK